MRITLFLCGFVAATAQSTTTPPPVEPDELNLGGWDALHCCETNHDCMRSNNSSTAADSICISGMCAPACQNSTDGKNKCELLAKWIGPNVKMNCLHAPAPTTTTQAPTTTTGSPNLLDTSGAGYCQVTHDSDDVQCYTNSSTGIAESVRTGWQIGFALATTALIVVVGLYSKAKVDADKNNMRGNPLVGNSNSKPKFVTPSQDLRL